MADTHLNYIDGEWVASDTGKTFAVHNPAAPDDTVGHFQYSAAADAERAIEAANRAQSQWASVPGPERGAHLKRVADAMEAREDELARTLTREEGKTLSAARPEVQRSVDTFRYYAEKILDFGGQLKSPSVSDKRMYTVREPLGVAALITPWNYPLVIPVWKLAPALATGNAAVVKPASATPNVTRKLFECLDSAGLPDGVVNLLTGSGSELSEPLTSHDAVDAVSFTGSTAVGQKLYRRATDHGKRAQTEMGGKNPTVVMPSADIEEAVEVVGDGAFEVTGQACTATSRAVVHEDCYEELLDGLVAYAEGREIGPGLADPDMGPQVSESERQGTLDYVAVGREEGATLVTGGGVPDGHGEGYFVEPTVFTDVESNMRIAQEEIFGPVVDVMRVSDFEEAVAVANDVDYGLSASILTQDISEANQFVAEMDVGVVKVNEQTKGAEPQMSFGGRKDSSSNTIREQGDAGMKFYTSEKTAYVNY